MPVELIYKHQQETYYRMKRQLKESHRAGYTYPTGCGKSFPALKYLEENQDKRVLFLAPRTEILKQFKEYIQKYIIGSNEPVKRKFKNWHFITYQGLKKFNVSKTKVDIIISDELHRTGAEEWQKDFDELLEANPDADKIGLTATPERTDGRNMLNEYFKDNIVYEFSLVDAISGDRTGEVVLNPSRYVRVLSELTYILDEYREKINNIVDQKVKEGLVRRFKKIEQTIQAADSLKNTFTKAMTKKDGKYIIFCKDDEDMQEAMKKAKEWFESVNSDMHIDYVYSGKNGNMTKTPKQNSITMEEFKNPSSENQSKLKLLFCVDKLNEGVHIPGISGAIMLRPTVSPIVYKQQIGRILTADQTAEETVIIDVANNWLRFKQTYKQYVEAIKRGEATREKYEEVTERQHRNYRSYDLVGEELELLDLMREIDEVTKVDLAKIDSSLVQVLQISKILTENGVDLQKLQLSKRTPEGGRYHFLLSEITQEGIDIEKIIEENNLDGKFKYGQRAAYFRTRYYDKNGNTSLSKCMREQAEQIGLVDSRKKEKHPYLVLMDEIENWRKEQNTQKLPATLTSKIGNLKKYIKSKKDSEKLSEEEKEIIEKAEQMGITGEVKHPFLILLEDVKRWQLRNETDGLPKEREAYKKMPPGERPEEYLLSKRITNLKGFLAKYKDISEEEFLNLPSEIQEIILASSEMGIGASKYQIVNRMRTLISEHVETNMDIRSELNKRVREFKESRQTKGELKND